MVNMLDMFIDVNKLSILNVLFTFPENAGPMPAAGTMPAKPAACLISMHLAKCRTYSAWKANEGFLADHASTACAHGIVFSARAVRLLQANVVRSGSPAAERSGFDCRILHNILEISKRKERIIRFNMCLVKLNGHGAGPWMFGEPRRIGAESGFLRVAFCSGCGSEDGRQEERGLQHRRRLVPEIESLELPAFIWMKGTISRACA